MNDNQHVELIKKLETLIKINSAILIEGKDFRDQVNQLRKLGMQPKEIAEVTGKTANNVSVTINYLKKNKLSNKK